MQLQCCQSRKYQQRYRCFTFRKVRCAILLLSAAMTWIGCAGVQNAHRHPVKEGRAFGCVSPGINRPLSKLREGNNMRFVFNNRLKLDLVDTLNTEIVDCIEVCIEYWLSQNQFSQNQFSSFIFIASEECVLFLIVPFLARVELEARESVVIDRSTLLNQTCNLVFEKFPEEVRYGTVPANNVVWWFQWRTSN